MSAVTSIYDKFLKMSDDEYHAADKDFLTSHQLGWFRVSPALYAAKKTTALDLEEDTKESLHIGRAAHVMILEGEKRYSELYTSDLPVNKKTGKCYGWDTKAVDDDFAERKITKLPIHPDDLSGLLTMTKNVRANPEAAKLLAEGQPSIVLRAEYNLIQAQSQYDWFSQVSGIVDLKTCQNLDWFEMDFRKYGYLEQMAFYVDMADLCLDWRPPVAVIAVEKNEPHRCGVWQIPAKAIDDAAAQNQAKIGELVQCLKVGVWPSGYEQPRVLVV